MAVQGADGQNVERALDILRDQDTPMKHRLEAVVGATQNEATARKAIVECGVELTQGTANEEERAELKELLETAANDFGIAVSPKEIVAARKRGNQEQSSDESASEDDTPSDETPGRTHVPSEETPVSESEGSLDHNEGADADAVADVDEGGTVDADGAEGAPRPGDSVAPTAGGEARGHDTAQEEVPHPIGHEDAESDDESDDERHEADDGVEPEIKSDETDESQPDEEDETDADHTDPIDEGIPTVQSDLEGRETASEDSPVEEPAGAGQTVDNERIQRDIDAGEDSERPTARDRVLPDDDYVIYDRLTRRSTLAQDTLGFEYVREDGIAVDDDHYIGLIHVTPRNWLVLNDEEKQSVFSAFVSFLRGSVQFPIQIVAIPRDFDVTHHTSNIQDADSRANHDKESPFLRHGRRRQVVWTQNAIDNRHVKDRDHYIVVRIRAEHVYSYMNKSGAFDGIPILEDLAKKVKRTTSSDTDDEQVASEDRCIAEVNQRRHSLREKLSNTDVRTEMVDERDEMMDILYHHYNHSNSPFEEYNHATYTEMLSTIVSPGAEH